MLWQFVDGGSIVAAHDMLRPNTAEKVYAVDRVHMRSYLLFHPSNRNSREDSCTIYIDESRKMCSRIRDQSVIRSDAVSGETQSCHADNFLKIQVERNEEL